jgi:hypothetical protein
MGRQATDVSFELSATGEADRDLSESWGDVQFFNHKSGVINEADGSFKFGT